MSIGTWLFTKFHGQFVGEDAYGNRYFQERRPRPNMRHRRWVMFKGKAEATKVPPEWHAWLHHTTDAPISDPRLPWMQPHRPNLTGTELAYVPPGDERAGGRRARATGDYEAWRPE